MSSGSEVQQGRKGRRRRASGSKQGIRKRVSAASLRAGAEESAYSRPSPEVWIRVARTLKAVAHPIRLQIIDLLERGERSVGEIVTTLGTKSALTSQQLGLMRDRGVLEARREGNHVYYRIANSHVVQVIHCVRRSCRMDEPES